MKVRTGFVPILAFVILALLFALWAGLLRIGWALPSFPNLALAHGPLMISGFLGVLIPLERAVAIRRKWMFAAPIVASLGWLMLLIVPFAGGLLLTLASLITLMILGVMVRREPRPHTVTMFVGVLAWVVGNILWMFGLPIFRIVHFWIAFLVLTIGGERLELSRVLRPAPGQMHLFSLAAAALPAGAILSLFVPSLGARLSGLALLGLSFWFLKNDIATRNIHHPNPLTRYIAFCLFAGFLWLALGGLLHLYFGSLYAGPLYDAALHSIFIGFVISMIFGHAPMIFPAILNTPITYRPVFYVQLVLLHISLLIRILGDLASQVELRKWAGFLNEIALLLFLAMTIYSIVKTQNPVIEKRQTIHHGEH